MKLVGAGVAFILICAIIMAAYAGYLIWRDQFSGKARSFVKRVDSLAEGKIAGTADVSILKQTPQSEFAAAGQGRVLAHVTWLLQHAGLNWSLGRFGMYTAAGAVLGSVAGVVTGLPAGACLALAGAGMWLPYGVVRSRSQKRSVKMENQLPDVLDMMAGMLRAGHTLPTALAMLSERMPEPLGEEFRTLHAEMTYGGSAEQAMNHLVERTRSENMRCLVMAILVQRETGGNLTEVLVDLSSVIRERLKLQGKIRSLSAEGRMSAWVLTILPFVVGIVIQFVNPDYLKIFWVDPTGIKMFYAMIVLLLLGNVTMRKLIRIRV